MSTAPPRGRAWTLYERRSRSPHAAVHLIDALVRTKHSLQDAVDVGRPAKVVISTLEPSEALHHAVALVRRRPAVHIELMIVEAPRERRVLLEPR